MKQRSQVQDNTSTEQEENSVSMNGRGNAFQQEKMSSSPEEDNNPQTKPFTRGEFTLLGQKFSRLQDLHNWLEQQRQDPNSTVPHEPELRIQLTSNSKIIQKEQCTWHYYQPNQKIIFEGNNSIVTGRNQGKNTPGWFLSYRPIVPKNDAATAAPANFEMRGLTIRGYESGGVEISPQTGVSPDAEHDAFKNDGGILAFVENAIFENNTFEKLGSIDTKYKDTSHKKDRFGAAGILFRGVQNSQITNNSFHNLENGKVRGTKTGERLMHGVYIRDHSGSNLVDNNSFDTISGDSIRLSNGSHDNSISNNRSNNAGIRTLVSEFYNSNQKRKEEDSHNNSLYNNNIGTLYNSTKKAIPFFEKHVHPKEGHTKDCDHKNNKDPIK